MATGTWLQDSFYRGLKETEATSNVSDYIEDRRAEPYQDVTSFDDAAGDGADQEDIPAAAGGGVDQEEALAGGGVDQEEALVGGGADQEDIPARGGADQEDMSVDDDDENEEQSEVLWVRYLNAKVNFERKMREQLQDKDFKKCLKKYTSAMEIWRRYHLVVSSNQARRMPRNTKVVTLYVSIVDFKISKNKIFMLGFSNEIIIWL